MSRGSARPGALVLVLLPVVLGGLGYLHARLSARPVWTVQEVEVTGNRSISTAELLHALHLGPGAPWWDVLRCDRGPVLRSHPRLSALRIGYRWPRSLSVEVEERESCLLVLCEPPLGLSDDGILLEPEEAIDPADLPCLTGVPAYGPSPGRRLDLPAVGSAWMELLEMRRESPALWKAISEIHYAGGADFQIYLREQHRLILWQPGFNHELKQQLPEILADLRRDQIDDAVLDLRFHDQLVVRRPQSDTADSTAKRGSAPPPPSARGARDSHGRLGA